jgi:hypothetical protein
VSIEDPDPTIRGRLEALAERGRHRGAADVLTAARTQAAAPVAMGRRPLLAAAAAALALALLSGGLVIATRDTSAGHRETTEVAGPAETTLTTGGDSTSPTTTAGPTSTSTAPAKGGPPTTAKKVGGKSTTTTRPLPEPIARLRLTAFGSCDAIIDYAKTEAAKLVGPYGVPGVGGPIAYTVSNVATGGLTNVTATTIASPALATTDKSVTAAPAQSGSGSTAAPAFSGTNVQEAGVDEPDSVKTDGHTVFAIEQNKLWAATADGTPQTMGSLSFANFSPTEMLLAGDRLVVFGFATTTAGGGAKPAGGIVAGPVAVQAKSGIVVVDVHDPAAMKTVSTLTVDGAYLSGRLVDGVARVVINSYPTGLTFQTPKDPTPAAQQQATAQNQTVITQSTQANWLPSLTIADGAGRTTAAKPAVDCGEALRPQSFSGFNMLTVLTVDPAHPDKPSSTTVMGSGGVIYSSASSLYVSTSSWVPVPVAMGTSVTSGPETLIHKFDISDSATAAYKVSGKVTGTVLNQYSFSEYKGNLRVATTGSTAGSTESYVTVLKDDGQSLTQIGQVSGLGKGERITGVRFIADVGYVVTFRLTDPLYTIDLSDPTKPRVVGELKILGYSAYLHPIGDGLLLGVGQDASDQGRRLGSQVSVFDVSDPANPKLLQRQVLGQGSSTAEFNPHAFLWWAPTSLTVLPETLYNTAGGTPPFIGAVGMTAGKDAITEIGRITHPAPAGSVVGPPIDRSLVIRDTVFTVSGSGLLASDLSTLQDKTWVPWK